MHQDFPVAELEAKIKKRSPPGNEMDLNFEKFMLALYTGCLFKKVELKEIPPDFRKTWPLPKRDDSKEFHKRFKKTLALGFIRRLDKEEEEEYTKYQKILGTGTLLGAEREKKTRETSSRSAQRGQQERETCCKTLEMPEIENNNEIKRMEGLYSGHLLTKKEVTKTEKLSLWRQLIHSCIKILSQFKKLWTRESKP